MDTKTDEITTQALLSEMAEVQRRNQRLTTISTAVLILIALALIISLVFLVPKLTTTLSDTQQLIRRVNVSLDELDAMAKNLDLTGETGEKLGALIDALSEIDPDSITESIQSLSGLLDGLSNFRLFR